MSVQDTPPKAIVELIAKLQQERDYYRSELDKSKANMPAEVEKLIRRQTFELENRVRDLESELDREKAECAKAKEDSRKKNLEVVREYKQMGFTNEQIVDFMKLP